MRPAEYQPRFASEAFTIISPEQLESSENQTDYEDHLRVMQPDGDGEASYRVMKEYIEVELLPVLSPDRGIRIVEIGSGYGHVLRFLAEKGYRNLGAIDSSRALLGRVRQRLGSLLGFLRRRFGGNARSESRFLRCDHHV